MRKWIAAALCLSMILSVCGCQQQEEGEPSVSSTAAPTTPTEGTEASVTQVPEKVTDPTQDPTEVAVPSEAPSEGETTPPVTGTQEIPLVAVSLIPVLEEETDENGTTIFRYQYQTITAILPDAPDASEKITSTMEERGKEAAGSVEEILNWARQDYTGDSSWVPYSCQVAFVPARVDATTVSFSGAVWSFSGGVHPNCTRISCSFDAASGDVLTLSDILSNTDVVEALYLKVMDGLDQRSRELDPNQSVWNDGYEEIVLEHFNLEHVSSASWYFSDTGMHFYFSPYEIAPYVVGEVDIEIPYAELRGILKEEYFPEATTYEGAFSLNAAHQEQVDSTQFEENILVDLKTDGTKVAVFSGSVIHRVQLEQGSWSAENQQTGSSQVVFAANRLTGQDLLLITADLTDAQAGLRLTLHCGENETRSYFISQNQEDGAILLEAGA